MTAALEGVSGHQHAPAALYPQERPVTHFTEAGWAPGPVWTGGKSRPHRDFFETFIVLSIVHIGTYITSASCFGSAFPIPCHLALTLTQPYSSGVCVGGGSTPRIVTHPDNGLLLPWVLA